MVRGFEVSNLLGEMNIRNTDIHPNWNDIRSTAYMNKLYEIPNPAFEKKYLYRFKFNLKHGGNKNETR